MDQETKQYIDKKFERFEKQDAEAATFKTAFALRKKRMKKIINIYAVIMLIVLAGIVYFAVTTRG